MQGLDAALLQFRIFIGFSGGVLSQELLQGKPYVLSSLRSAFGPPSLHARAPVAAIEPPSSASADDCPLRLDLIISLRSSMFTPYNQIACSSERVTEHTETVHLAV